MNTYLGQKGYTILKSEISVELQKQIKTDLTIRPYTPGAPPSQNSFPAYRESGAKLYVPHYYGVEQFGNPKENKVSEGMDADLVFNGSLRDYQIPVVEKFIQHVITPLRIENAQSASSSSLITAPEGGVLNERRCKKVPVKQQPKLNSNTLAYNIVAFGSTFGKGGYWFLFIYIIDNIIKHEELSIRLQLRLVYLVKMIHVRPILWRILL